MRLGIASTLLFSLALVACKQAPDGSWERVDKSEAPIYGGTLDTVDPAVVALYGTGSEGGYSCSGTIIDVSASGVATVITAAHCCGGESAGDHITHILFGNNYNQPTADITPTNQAWDMAYNTNAQSPTHDFCIVQFNSDSSTPAPIPAMDPSIDTGANALQAGTVVEFAGFGTTGASQAGQNNSKKYHVSGTLEQVDALTVEYSQANGTGPCSGDSGGPAFVTVGGVQYMAAVTSYGDQSCTQFGVSGRVSGDWTWISSYLSGTTSGSTTATSASTGTGGQTCQDCADSSQSGACSAQASACGSDQDCVNLDNCLGNCSDDTCVTNCESQYPNGVTDLSNYDDCVCNTACPTECASECGSGSSSSTSATSGPTTATTGVGPSTTTGVGPSTTTGVGTSATTGTSGAGGAFSTTTSTATGGVVVGAGGDDTKSDDNSDFGTSKSACGCRIEDRTQGGFAPFAGLGLALMMVSRRRRRRR